MNEILSLKNCLWIFFEWLERAYLADVGLRDGFYPCFCCLTPDILICRSLIEITLFKTSFIPACSISMCGASIRRCRHRRHRSSVLSSEIHFDLPIFFCVGALFRGKGGPPVLEKPARHLPRQGQGFVRPPVCPTPPTISSTYGGASGGQLTDCCHQMSSYGQCILFLYCCIVCLMSLVMN